MKKAISLSLLTVFLLTLGGNEKKVILLSFELRNARTEHIARNIALFEKLPFDGIVISDMKTFRLRHPAGSKQKWDISEYAREIADMKVISSGKLKDNFLLMFWTPKERIPMTDEAGWERCAHNAGIMARAAREGGCVGFAFDYEDYNNSQQFIYQPEDGATFEEAAGRMRRHGAQVMRAIAKEFPSIKIMALHLLCAVSREVFSDEAEYGLKMKNELWPYFVNGLYDELPDQAKLIEGNELGYYFQADTPDFTYAAFDSVRRNMKFILPENRKKFKTNGEFAFGMYPDSYSMTTGSFQKQPLGGSKLKRFRQDLSEALRITDEYVWLYCEKNAWIGNWDEAAIKAIFPASGIPSKTTFLELHPGIVEAIELAKAPAKVGEAIVKAQKNSLKNLAPNPKCDPNAEITNPVGPPYMIEGGYLKGPAIIPGWYFWPHWDAKPEKRSHCTEEGVDDKFSLFGKDLPKGAFVTDIKVNPGSFYYVESMMRGTGNALIHVKWRTPVKSSRDPSTGKVINYRDWLFRHVNSRDSLIYFPEGSPEQWRQAGGIVQAPDGADVMTVLLYMKQGKDSGKYNYFDNIGIYEIQPISPDENPQK